MRMESSALIYIHSLVCTVETLWYFSLVALCPIFGFEIPSSKCVLIDLKGNCNTKGRSMTWSQCELKVCRLKVDFSFKLEQSGQQLSAEAFLILKSGHGKPVLCYARGCRRVRCLIDRLLIKKEPNTNRVDRVSCSVEYWTSVAVDKEDQKRTTPTQKTIRISIVKFY